MKGGQRETERELSSEKVAKKKIWCRFQGQWGRRGEGGDGVLALRWPGLSPPGEWGEAAEEKGDEIKKKIRWCVFPLTVPPQSSFLVPSLMEEIVASRVTPPFKGRGR